MKKISLVLAAVIIMVSCTPKRRQPPSDDSVLNLVGTWKLISGITIQGRDTTVTDYTKDQETIKIINDSHFAFLTHDLNKGKDSTATFVAGGGSYTLKGDQYTEHLSYCNYWEWEGNEFNFTVQIKGDTLIQTGMEKIEELNVDRKIIETYIKKAQAL